MLKEIQLQVIEIISSTELLESLSEVTYSLL